MSQRGPDTSTFVRLLGRSLLAGVGVLVVGLIGLVIWALFINDPRRDIDLARWVDRDDAWHRAMMPGARWATQELCSQAAPCIQAVTSDTVTMYRFADRDDAEAVARTFGGDAYLTGWIVVRFEPDGLTPAQRADFEYGVGCVNTWVSEDGRDC